MDEVTGPILAVALVLCAVFVPCAFISGITGQFFRQFAVTIAVSTVISAINAADHDPVAGGADLQVGGCGTSSTSARRCRGGSSRWRLGCSRPGSCRSAGPGRVGSAAEQAATAGDYAWRAIWLLPGAVAGGAVVELMIRPVNAVLRWFFRGFNRGFDLLTAAYGWTVGKLLRLSAVVLLAYGGLLVLTVLDLPAGADRLHPAAGPGPAHRQRPAARLGVAGAHQGGRGADRGDRP